ncbi:hypothetical protein [Zoogloea sp.]|uniref:hypothetical protein n=1 Tax=Zoogloea sp. TaxID=49181 RepID=UPI002639C968|nr:hypothetical protein [Zoogloea sp.]
MTGPREPLLALLLPALLLVAYDGLVHYVSTIPNAANWAVAVTLLPALGIGLGLVARRFGPLAAALGGLALALFATFFWPALQHRLGLQPGGHLRGLYLTQYLATNLTLALWFGRTLVGGRTPACTAFAAALQPAVSPLVARYTRRLTLAWTAFFVLSAATSALLYAVAPAAVWSFFSNLFYLPSLALMFIVEGLIRRVALPPEERHGIVESIRAYMASTRPGPPIRQ